MSDKIATREYPLSGFTAIRAGRFDVEVARGDTHSITVRADDSLIDKLSVHTSGDALILRIRPIWWRFGPLTLEATITMPTLRAIELRDAASARISGFRGGADFDAELSGASELRGDIEAKTASFVASGASRVRLGGRSEYVSIQASGASMLDLEKMAVDKARVDLSGASHVRLNVTSSIESILASGASHLRYLGDPAIGRMQMSGASHIARV